MISNETGCSSQGCQDTKIYRTWWEFYPYNSLQAANVDVSPGDKVHILVKHSGASEVIFLIHNEISTHAISFSETFPASDQLDKTQAEWIFERVAKGGYNVQLYPEDDSSWTAASATNANNTVAAIANTDRTKDTMVASCTDSTPIARATALGNDGKSFAFQVAKLWQEVAEPLSMMGSSR